MTEMLKRFQGSEEGLDLVQLLIAVVILGALLTVGVLTLIGKVNSAKNTSANAAVANAVTAAKVVLSEGNETTAVGQQAAIADAISGSNVTVAVAAGPGDITLTGTRGATATVTQLGAVTKTNAS